MHTGRADIPRAFATEAFFRVCQFDDRMAGTDVPIIEFIGIAKGISDITGRRRCAVQIVLVDVLVQRLIVKQSRILKQTHANHLES